MKGKCVEVYVLILLYRRAFIYNHATDSLSSDEDLKMGVFRGL